MNKNKISQFLEDYWSVANIEQGFIWEIPVVKQLFYLFFAAGASLILLKTIREKTFPFEDAKKLLLKFCLVSMLFPAIKCVDYLVSSLSVQIANGTKSATHQVGISKYAAIEMIQMSNLQQSVKEAAAAEIHALASYKITHEQSKQIIRDQSKKSEQYFIEIANEKAHFLHDGSLEYESFSPRFSLGKTIENTSAQGIFSAFLGWTHHLLRSTVLLGSQITALLLSYLMVIAMMFSFLPWFKDVFSGVFKIFLALKFVPIFVILVDFIIDDLNIFTITLNALGGSFADANFAAICYAMLKIVLIGATTLVSFVFFKQESIGHLVSVSQKIATQSVFKS